MDNGALYCRYIMNTNFLPKTPGAQHNLLGQVFGSAPWHGDPMATLRRAFLAIAGPTVRGMPGFVIRELQELQNLYREDDEAADEADEGAGNLPSPSNTGTTPILDTSSGSPQNPEHSTTGETSPGQVELDDFQRKSVNQAPALSRQRKRSHAESDFKEGVNKANSRTIKAQKVMHEPISPDSLRSPPALHVHASASSGGEIKDIPSAGKPSKPALQKRWQWGPATTCQDVVNFYVDVVPEGAVSPRSDSRV